MRKKKIGELEPNKREVHDLGDHILLFQGQFDRGFCEECIDVFEDADRAGMTVTRENSNISISDKAISHTSLMPSSLPRVQHLQNCIQEEILPEFFKKYPINEHYNYMGCGGAKIQKTEPQQGYHVWHMEQQASMDSYRTVCAWALFLNDVEEGGELEFLYQSKRIKPKQGDFVLWPSGYTHMHRGNPPLSGTKYIYTGWIDSI